MIQLGISAFYHDAAACVVIDGKVVAAAEEERFTGIKHDSSFPVNAINWCLRESRTSINNVDQVCWYENPEIKKDRIIKSFNKHFFKTLKSRIKFNINNKKNDPETIIRKGGFKGQIVYNDHHLSHAAFSYYTSPYENAGILTVDGVGEWETVTISHGTRGNIKKLKSINFPNSLGLLYSTITAYLGFKPNEGEYKVMGLAPYGDPNTFLPKLRQLLSLTTDGFIINQKYFTWEYSDKVMFTKELYKLLGILPRFPEEEIKQEHKDLACAIQKLYEENFIRLVKKTQELTGEQNICLGGGCAYNGVANKLAYNYFNSVYVPFAPSDAGSAIGACLANYTGPKKINNTPYLGPDFSDTQVHKVLQTYNNIRSFRLSDELLLKKTSELIKDQKIVAWFQGKMEFGARALGNRSIIASPQTPQMREKLNHVIKKREGFRPFAPSVKADKASRLFDLKENVPYMNIVVNSRTKQIPSATHIDNSARVQTVSKEQNERYYLLLEEVQRTTGLPVLLNTSFNLKDQTITMTPTQAIDRFLDSEIDFLVINNYLIQKYESRERKS